jgi:hypothetical protein
MAESPSRTADGANRSRWELRGWLAPAVFVAGLLVGGVLVGVLRDDPPLPVAGSTAAATLPSEGADAEPAPDGSAAGGTVELVVNDECLRAVNAAQDMARVVDDLGEAAADLDAARLDEVVRRLQPLQDRLQADVTACRAVTRLPDGSAVTSTTPRPPSSTPAPPS